MSPRKVAKNAKNNKIKYERAAEFAALSFSLLTPRRFIVFRRRHCYPTAHCCPTVRCSPTRRCCPITHCCPTAHWTPTAHCCPKEHCCPTGSQSCHLRSTSSPL